MKKTFLILGGIALVLLLLMIRFIFSEKGGMDEEKEWFARQLRYEFSATVDSVRIFNPERARIWCRVTAGKPLIYRQDSLRNSLKKHSKLWLISHQSADTITFVMHRASQVNKGDSLRLSSQNNTIQYFRVGKLITSESLSEALMNWGKPPFRTQ